MIDIHCHLLPGIDDGARDLAMSVRMAQVLVDDGVEAVICTPHILPGLYHNTGVQIRAAVAHLRTHLAESELQLEIYAGADAHISVDFRAKLNGGEIPTLAGSRYVLIELPHHLGPNLIEPLFFRLLVAGYVPVLSHPERMPWIQVHYSAIARLVKSGIWLQITAGSLLGDFGRNAKYWAERMLDDGLVHVLATDAHNLVSRPPNLSRGHDIAAKRVGDREAEQLVRHRPYAILRDAPPGSISLSSSRSLHVDW